MELPKFTFLPIISSIQKIALYETKARFYLMGSNNTQTRFRVLKIDRMEPLELSVVDDKLEYSQDEIRDLVTMIDVGNRPRPGHRLPTNGVARVVSAFGIVGFVRFLEGYYIVLVTKRRKVGVIGYHTIYKIEDTSMIYIPSDGNVRHMHPDESRYVKMFQSIDLSSNFYFSYDITHTLQSNLSVPAMGLLEAGTYGVRNHPNRRFVWNNHLIRDIESELHPDWLLYVMHGFVGQSNISIFGRSVYITVIARRSNKYAGTRFLKRGGNCEGDVGNEVETEQMVHDSGVSSLSRGRFSSFVQMRGSIPAKWSQDISKMVPKPTISFDLSDPFAETAGEHFNQLLRHYGSPIIILNLVKKREKKKHESILSQEFSSSVNYLNQFLPPQHHVQYVSLDMARVNKGKEANVMNRLAALAHNAICKTGIFQNQAPYFNQDSPQAHLGEPRPSGGRIQTGIIRVNCVDCLDRTNTAQFAIGKCALGLQLYSLGVLQTPKLDFDSDCVRMLEELYEDHGDTLALQYGGSQLVHRIKTYRKTAPWTSQGNDIMQTLSRYYSNTFSDTEKQNTMNLFLGVFVPQENMPPIWDQVTDYYLHHPLALGRKLINNRFPQTQWWDQDALDCLPRAVDEKSKTCREVIWLGGQEEVVDGYHDYHRPHELSVLSDVYAYKISHSVKDFMPHFTTNFSPFTVRVRPGRRREETSKSGETMKNPSLTGQSSSSWATSSTSSSAGSDDSDEEESVESYHPLLKETPCDNVAYDSLFPTIKQVYGVEIEYPQKPDVLLYKRYVTIGRMSWRADSGCGEMVSRGRQPIMLNVCNKTSADNRAIYQTFMNKGKTGAMEPNSTDLASYCKYASVVHSR